MRALPFPRAAGPSAVLEVTAALVDGRQVDHDFGCVVFVQDPYSADKLTRYTPIP